MQGPSTDPSESVLLLAESVSSHFRAPQTPNWEPGAPVCSCSKSSELVPSCCIAMYMAATRPGAYILNPACLPVADLSHFMAVVRLAPRGSRYVPAQRCSQHEILLEMAALHRMTLTGIFAHLSLPCQSSVLLPGWLSGSRSLCSACLPFWTFSFQVQEMASNQGEPACRICIANNKMLHHVEQGKAPLFFINVAG